MAGAQQPLHEQLADITGTADHQDILGHEVFLSLWARHQHCFGESVIFCNQNGNCSNEKNK